MSNEKDPELNGKYEEVSDRAEQIKAAPTEEIFHMPGHEWKLTSEEEQAVRDMEKDARTTPLQRRVRRFIY
jgi:hypothetical protein